MKTKYKVKKIRLINYGDKYECSIMLKVGQTWRLFIENKDSVVLLRKNVAIGIDKELFELYFEKVESEGKNENK